MKTKEGIRQKIEKEARQIYHDYPAEEHESAFKSGAFFGYRLGAAEKDKEIAQLRKEVEELNNQLKSIRPTLHELRSYQGMTVTEQNEMVEQNDRLTELLRRTNPYLMHLIDCDISDAAMCSCGLDHLSNHIENELKQQP